MPLTSGTRLGPYAIIAKLGEGGMGEVYSATDTRLSRTVAVKVLPPHWADNREMKERFEREARTIASLSDPHICALHDIGHEGDIDFLVMEYLEGETLAARIARGRVPLDEALTIAIAITSALDKAHRQGVIHRDLKPSNVMLTAAGAKLLDFGLAKMAAGAAPAGRELSAPGMMLGTLQYMAPEQLEGADADARSDLFALGVIVQEMVTGAKVFDAKSRVLLMSAIATHTPPPLSHADPATPPELDHIIATCLAKDPADRWQTARDVLGELQAIADGNTDREATGSVMPVRGGSPLYRGAAAAALVLAIGVSAPAVLYLRGEAAPAELRFRVPIQLSAQPATVPVAGVAASVLFTPSSFALSPDGRTLAFTARTAAADPLTLYTRPVGAVVAQALTATAGDVAQPFWSADGRSIAFVSGGRLKKIAAGGGAPQDLCAVTDFYGGAWNSDNVIIFGSENGLFRVPAEGGTPEPLTSVEGSETGHFWPSFLPDGKRFLYTAWSADVSARAVYVGEAGTKQRTRVLTEPSNAVYSRTGHLLFHRGKAVFAQSFDARSMAVSGEPVRVADEVTFRDGDGRGHFAVSSSGVLAYFENSAVGGLGPGPQGETADWHLAWASRDGRVDERPGPSGNYRGVEVSPDASRIAVHRHESAGGDIWIFEPSGSETRLTWNAAQHNSSPIWSPDGRDIAYSSVRDGKPGIYRKRSDGSGTEELLHVAHATAAPMSWSPDGKWIVFGVQDPKNKSDLWLLSLPDKKAAPLVNTSALETHAQISPDGKWIAYSSDGVGNRREIHVQPFPSGQGHWQISDAGGDWPRWRKDGKEIYFHSIGPVANPRVAANPVFIGPLSAVAVNGTGASFEHGQPKRFLNLRAINFAHSGGDYHTYAVSPDGQRFLSYQFVIPTVGSVQATGPDHTSGLVIAMNWEHAVKK